MTEHEQRRWAVNAVAQVACGRDAVGTLVAITEVEDLAQIFPDDPPEAAWIIRWHVMSPQEKYETYVVTSRNGQPQIEMRVYQVVASEETA